MRNGDFLKMNRRSNDARILLVGDNPFHNISHLSQDRARTRSHEASSPEYAAGLVATSLKNGASGFMFSVSETTLSILKTTYEKEKNGVEQMDLYAIVPYAYEYVTLANQLGGIPGLAKRFAEEIMSSKNVKAALMGVKGVLASNPASLMKTYLAYEISRVKTAIGKNIPLRSVMLHQVVTDMALGLDLQSIFEIYIDYLSEKGITPGFNTGNFVYLINKFNDWKIDLGKVVIAAPFNKVGFQMNPSRQDCEETLRKLPEPSVIAISILAAGYLRLPEAVDYIAGLPNILGVSVGVSKEEHARETFRLLAERLNGQAIWHA